MDTKRLLSITFLWLAACLLHSCSKEQEGGIQFRARTRHNFNYSDFNASLSYAQYGEPIKRVSSRNINNTLVISSVPDGKYHWDCSVSYDSARVISGTKSFDGDILIEKGKIKEILIEVD